MDKDPLVSIVVPIYNVEEYLERCIQSILNQSYKKIEIVLVDDGSTDNSFSICNKYSEVDNRIKVIHKQNEGLVLARKTGLKIANGEYIGFVDSDDYIDNNMISELVDCLKDSGADFVHSGYIEEGKYCIEHSSFSKNQIDLETHRQKINFFQNYILGGEKQNLSSSIVTKLFKGEFVKKCYETVPDKQQYGEDLLCFCSCVMEGKNCVLLPKAFYHYTIRQDSMCHQKSKESIIKEIQLHHYLIDFFEQNKCLNELSKNISLYSEKNMLSLLRVISKEAIEIPCFYYRNIEMVNDKKIIIYGAGSVGRDYYIQFSRYQDCKIVAWVDINWEQIKNPYAKIISIEEAIKSDFDYVVIAVNNEKIAFEIKEKLNKVGVDKGKILYDTPEKYF